MTLDYTDSRSKETLTTEWCSYLHRRVARHKMEEIEKCKRQVGRARAFGTKL